MYVSSYDLPFGEFYVKVWHNDSSRSITFNTNKGQWYSSVPMRQKWYFYPNPIHKGQAHPYYQVASPLAFLVLYHKNIGQNAFSLIKTKTSAASRLALQTSAVEITYELNTGRIYKSQ